MCVCVCVCVCVPVCVCQCVCASAWVHMEVGSHQDELADTSLFFTPDGLIPQASIDEKHELIHKVEVSQPLKTHPSLRKSTAHNERKCLIRQTDKRGDMYSTKSDHMCHTQQNSPLCEAHGLNSSIKCCQDAYTHFIDSSLPKAFYKNA